MQKQVRVRFAPSPTGPLHIGGLRTALFNYLFARKHQGTFILRIEDTDQNRLVSGAEKYIREALEWCGIAPDEGEGYGGDFGPYTQSQRKELYKKYIAQLLESGHAYYAFDTAEALENHRKKAEEAGEVFIYNWQTRLSMENSFSLSKEEVQQRLDRAEEYVIRFNMPQMQLHINDLIRGDISIDTQTLDDKVLFKSDGMPTYHLANIVDDHLMQISHVIRGEEWLPSMPLHVLMYRAFGWEAPQFAHLPLILKPIGNGKLSKRDGDKFGFPVFPLNWTDPQTGLLSPGYKEQGYLPEAVLNFLALLGWNAGDDRELYTKEELAAIFDLERIHKAGARFNPEKIKWFNHHYLQERTNESLAQEFALILREKAIEASTEKLVKIIALIKERATFVQDFWELSHFYFQAPNTYDEKAFKKQNTPQSKEILHSLVEVLQHQLHFSAPELEQKIKDFTQTKNMAIGQLMPLLRLALVGEMKGASVYDIMEIIGQKESLNRFEKMAQQIK